MLRRMRIWVCRESNDVVNLLYRYGMALVLRIMRLSGLYYHRTHGLLSASLAMLWSTYIRGWLAGGGTLTYSEIDG